MAAIKSISLVIPAYNQANSILEDLKKISNILEQLNFSYQIIVVNDGSIDNTQKKAELFKSFSKKGKFIVDGYPKNKGKGYAVKFGVEKAQGDIIGFIDAGMDIDPSGIKTLIDVMLKSKADIVVGSKIHKDSQVNAPVTRKILSWGYQKLAQSFFGFDVRDTQVGLKLFKKNAAKKIFQNLKTAGFAFDIELLTLANLLNLKVVEAPVNVHFKKSGSITSANFWKVVSVMFWDTSLVFWRLKIIHSYDKIRK